MNVEAVLQELDKAVEENRGPEVEGILSRGIEQAVSEGDNGALLQLLNELIGYYREVGRTEDSYQISDAVIALCDQMGLHGSIPYATSLLNIASAYRAGGRLSEALELYDEVEGIYRSSLPEDSMLIASFYNNKALLLQEMGQYETAVNSLKRALPIVEKAGEAYDIAVTHANLANTYLGLEDYDDALSEAAEAEVCFMKLNAVDSHYAAALYAKGLSLEKKGRHSDARKELEKALKIMDETLGKTQFYYRIYDELRNIKDDFVSGMMLAKHLYKKWLKPELDAKLPEWTDKIAVGLVGKGSDCYGYDDEASRDHDWGPGLCIWVTKETYDQIGQRLEDIYASLPEEFEGLKKAPTVSKSKRRGVFIIEDFYKELLGRFPLTDEDWYVIDDHSLSTAVNGEVFVDCEGHFTEIRDDLAKGYPMEVLYKKLAQSAALFSQQAQYNYKRVLARGDDLTAQMMLYGGLKEALKLVHYIEGKYPPHDKWLYKSAKETTFGYEIAKLFDARDPEAIGKALAFKMYEKGYISDIDDYLDHHTEELMFKALYANETVEELADKVTRLEFKAFDKVENEGGRASCQDDFYTFEIMRKSQYLTWNREMLMQYLYDFDREFKLGHNLITEKYGRMMQSTDPKRYDEIKDNFPEVSAEKAAIIEEIVAMQVSWMVDFAERYPKLGGRARNIHSNQDFVYDTSYETYLRGEISTYSDKMLELYAKYVVSHAQEGKNIAEEIMMNSVKMYGYESLEAAEAKA